MHVRKGLICGAVSLILATAAVPAFAQSAGKWTLGVGLHQVNPKSDSGVDGLDVGSDMRPTITGEYFVADNLGIEVLAALPFQHDIDIKGAGTVATAKQLPPTVSLQYHFNGGGTVSPFVGVGLNYTTFFDESTKGALAGSTLKLDDSWGLAAHAGLDFAVGNGAVRVDVRWIDIDSDASVNGAKLGKVNIDPLVYGTAYVFKF
jgi:outer membrane protein